MRVPKHIAIIPDGNRRWAQGKGFKKHQGYTHGLNPGVRVLQLAKAAGVKEITYYGFTTDNCKRPTTEVKAFSQSCVDAVELIKKEGAALLVVGDSQSKLFPKELTPYTDKRVGMGNNDIKVNFLVNYGWEWDMSNMHTTNSNRSDILSHLYSKDISHIDLVIRWGDRRRLSGLLPVQSVYADFFVVEEMWPDFSDEHFNNALNWYSQQDITLGG